MIQNFLIRKMIKSQLGGKACPNGGAGRVPDEMIDKLIQLVSENPDFFKKVAEEVKRKTDAGVGQQEAVMQVLSSHESEFKGLQEKLK